MSTPATPRSSGNPTREQLDDLDALLQRMLDLPVNRPEDDGVEPASMAPPEVPAAEARVTVVESPRVPTPAKLTRPAPHDSPKPAAPSASVPAGRANPVVQKVRSAGTMSKPTKPSIPEVPPIAVTPAQPPQARESKPPTSSTRWVTLGLESLIALNVAFDRGAERLGKPGRWLQGARGRTVLGATGLCLIGLALLLLILDWFGWTW